MSPSDVCVPAAPPVGFNQVFHRLKRRRLFQLFGVPADGGGAVGSVPGTALSLFSFLPW